MPLNAPAAQIHFAKKYGVIAGILLFSYFVFRWGVFSQVSLGDEIHHYRFAKDSFQLNGRAMVDSLYPNAAPPAVLYNTDPGWPLALALLWKMMGAISLSAAQAYHACFFVLLLGSVYAIAKKEAGEAAGIWSVFLLATTPMVTSFGILFYTDLPAAAVFCLSLAFFRKERYVFAGLAAGLAFLVKKTTAVFVPWMIFFLLFEAFQKKENFKSAAFKFLGFVLPFLVIAGAEILWRRAHFSVVSVTTDDLLFRFRFIYEGSGNWLQAFFAPLRNNEFSNSHILNPQDVVRYFGIPLLCFFVCGILSAERKGLFWTGLFLSYLAAVFILRILPDIRYFLPVVPIMALWAGRYAAKRSSKILCLIAVLLGLLQFFSAGIYTEFQRRIPYDVQRGFNFIRQNTPEDALVLYPEANILEYAGRKIVWTSFNIRKVFFGPEEEKIKELERIGVDYIAVKKSRVYDDQKNSPHTGGYPASFLKTLKSWPFAEQVYDNPGFALWKINRKAAS